MMEKSQRIGKLGSHGMPHVPSREAYGAIAGNLNYLFKESGIPAIERNRSI
jgi:hypothetical protein